MNFTWGRRIVGQPCEGGAGLSRCVACTRVRVQVEIRVEWDNWQYEVCDYTTTGAGGSSGLNYTCDPAALHDERGVARHVRESEIPTIEEVHKVQREDEI